MTLHYQLTLSDWLEAAKTMKSNDGLRRGSWQMLVLCCLLVVGFFLTCDNFYKKFAMIMIFCALPFLLFINVGLRFLWSSALKNNPDSLPPVALHANKEELYFQKRDADTRIKWGNICVFVTHQIYSFCIGRPKSFKPFPSAPSPTKPNSSSFVHGRRLSGRRKCR